MSEESVKDRSIFLRTIVELKNELNNINLKDSDTGYILWNFVDIMNAINNLPNNSKWITKKRLIQQITAYAISVRDKIEMYSWGKGDI